MVSTFLVLACLAASAPQSKIAVMDVTVRAGIPASVGQALSENILSEVRRRRPQASVVSADEIREMLAVQGQRQKLGCHAERDIACLAEIGGALGAERMVIGALNKIGRTYVFSLKLVDVARASVLGSASVNLATHEDDDLLGAATKLVDQLFPGLPAATPAPQVAAEVPAPVAATEAPPTIETSTASTSHSHLPSILIGVAGLAAGGVAVFGLTRVLHYNSEVSTVNKGPSTGSSLVYGQFQSDQKSAQLWQPLGIGLGVLAVAGLTTAVIVW